MLPPIDMDPQIDAWRTPLPHLPDDIWFSILSFAIPDQTVRHDGSRLNYPSAILLTNRKCHDIARKLLTRRRLQVFLNGSGPGCFQRPNPESIPLDEGQTHRLDLAKSWSAVPFELFSDIVINIHPDNYCSEDSPQFGEGFLEHMADVSALAQLFSATLKQRLARAEVIGKVKVSLMFHDVCPFHQDKLATSYDTASLLPSWSQRELARIISAFDWIPRRTASSQDPDSAVQLPRIAWISTSIETLKEAQSGMLNTLRNAWVPGASSLSAADSIPLMAPIDQWLEPVLSPHRRLMTQPAASGFSAVDALGADSEQWSKLEVLSPINNYIQFLCSKAIESQICCDPQRAEWLDRNLNKHYGKEVGLVNRLCEAVLHDLKHYAQTKMRLENNWVILSAGLEVRKFLKDAWLASTHQALVRRVATMDIRPVELVKRVNVQLQRVVDIGLIGKEAFMEDM